MCRNVVQHGLHSTLVVPDLQHVVHLANFSIRLGVPPTTSNMLLVLLCFALFCFDVRH